MSENDGIRIFPNGSISVSPTTAAKMLKRSGVLERAKQYMKFRNPQDMHENQPRAYLPTGELVGKSMVSGCNNIATHTWSGHPTCNACGSAWRHEYPDKPFPETKSDEWISIHDELPRRGQDVWVYDSMFGNVIAWTVVCEPSKIDGDISHWMPRKGGKKPNKPNDALIYSNIRNED